MLYEADLDVGRQFPVASYVRKYLYQSMQFFSTALGRGQLQAWLSRSPWGRLHGPFFVAGNDTGLKQAVKLQWHFETLKWQKKNQEPEKVLKVLIWSNT